MGSRLSQNRIKIELAGDDKNKYVKMEMANPVTEDGYMEVGLPQVTLHGV